MPSPPATVAASPLSPPPGTTWVPGTHVAMQAAAGFELVGPPVELRDEAEDIRVVIQELPGGPFAYPDRVLEQGGLEIIARADGRVGEQSRWYREATTRAPDGKDMVYLALSTDETSMVIQATLPAGDAAARGRVRQALETVVFDPRRRIEPPAGMAFRLLPVEPLWLAGILNTSAAYNTLGYLVGPTTSEPQFRVEVELADPPADPETFLRDRADQMRQLVLSPQVDSVETLEIAGLPATEVVARAMDNLEEPDRTILVYQLLVADRDHARYALLTGIAPAEVRDVLLPAFRASASSFALVD